MSNEAAMRQYIRDGLHRVGFLTTHHEDMLNVGLPDMSYSGNQQHGWIELKYLRAWPKRVDTVVRIEHYTKEQRAWLLRRGQLGGNCFLLLRVGREHLLLGWITAQLVGELNRTELCRRALGHWVPGNGGRMIDFTELADRITR